jgi:FtsZ-interacting cell division protein ZipA
MNQPHWLLALLAGTLASLIAALMGGWWLWRMQERRRFVDDRVTRREFTEMREEIEHRMDALEAQAQQSQQQSALNAQAIEAVQRSLNEHKTDTRQANERIEARLDRILEHLR